MVFLPPRERVERLWMGGRRESSRPFSLGGRSLDISKLTRKKGYLLIFHLVRSWEEFSFISSFPVNKKGRTGLPSFERERVPFSRGKFPLVNLFRPDFS